MKVQTNFYVDRWTVEYITQTKIGSFEFPNSLHKDY